MNITEITSPVQQELKVFEKKFNNQLHSQVPIVDTITQYIASKKGKRLRPLLVYLSAKLAGQVTEKTHAAAVVVEMFHTATLVHDDVVDESSTRRGASTVNQLWDNKISILIGDFLFSKTLGSITAMQDEKSLSVISKAAEEITEGELLQITYAGDVNTSEAQYFDLIDKKTAALFCAACHLGALTSGADKESIEKMANFGTALGIAFQIADDLLDYLGDSKVMGKPTGNDLKEGKITLPLIYALHNCTEKQHQNISSVLEKGIQDEQSVVHIVDFTKSCGGVDYAIEKAKEYAQSAQQILDAFVNSEIKDALQKLVHLSIHRQK